MFQTHTEAAAFVLPLGGSSSPALLYICSAYSTLIVLRMEESVNIPRSWVENDAYLRQLTQIRVLQECY
uniref:Uncharacterized protein n=1 Tax=Echinococcus granulosus TaxID=6210 RepID=A0A068WYK9_ECHGR|nr:hypothetical protein EgrG_002042600 [Echinococcus granulosus]